MISTIQDVEDITSFGYPVQSIFTRNTSRIDGRPYREQTKTIERIMW